MKLLPNNISMKPFKCDVRTDVVVSVVFVCVGVVMSVAVDIVSRSNSKRLMEMLLGKRDYNLLSKK